MTDDLASDKLAASQLARYIMTRKYNAKEETKNIFISIHVEVTFLFFVLLLTYREVISLSQPYLKNRTEIIINGHLQGIFCKF
jgi:hypothetical protein